jgi:hypothetical protein
LELPAGEASITTVHGQPAQLIAAGDDNALVAWTEDGISIAVGGRITADELLKVAESLQ